MIVEEIMSKNPGTVKANSPLLDAVDLLQSLSVRHLPVVNEEGELVGMLSDRDLRSLTIDMVRATEPIGTVVMRGSRPVTELMSGSVISVNPDAEIAEVIELMLENKVGAVPVVDGDGTIVGMVSYVDVLRNWPG
jgi:CBS domain-containing protein